MNNPIAYGGLMNLVSVEYRNISGKLEKKQSSNKHF